MTFAYSELINPDVTDADEVRVGAMLLEIVLLNLFNCIPG
jgi:hypothetical protein